MPLHRSQYLLQKLSKRITTVTIMDGITMGSAVLFGFNSNFSVATERTVWAVPEVTQNLAESFTFLNRSQLGPFLMLDATTT